MIRVVVVAFAAGMGGVVGLCVVMTRVRHHNRDEDTS